MKPDKTTIPIRLSSGITVNPFIKELLAGRGISTESATRTFLEPKLKDLPDPFLMKDMDLAVRLVEECIGQNFTILIWGDYDVDGTTATALLIQFFQSIGYDAGYHIPNRLTDGYGIQQKGLEQISGDRDPTKTLLITVDNGISAHKAIEYAKEQGYKVIVTDHHVPPTVPVDADAIINPSQQECNFPDKTLAGVGVAFYLSVAIRVHLQKTGYFNNNRELPNMKTLLDLVAIGTVADMVPLRETNRILVRAGMEVLAKNGNIGLTALCKKTNIDSRNVRSEDISFQLAPKINAAGRLGDASMAVKLFLAKESKLAATIATELVKNNERRKSINIQNFTDAKDELNKSTDVKKYAIVVSGDYHIGVAGIVASNLVEKYKKPSVVLCLGDDGLLKGSGRSVVGVDLHRALEKCSSLLLGFGGHKMAGGMSLLPEKLVEFQSLFDKEIMEQIQLNGIVEESLVDTEIQIKDLFHGDILRQLQLLEPFGTENPQPIFRDTVSSFMELAPLGKDKAHLRCSFEGNRGKQIKGVGFGIGHLIANCKSNAKREILYTPTLNNFRGRRNWQVRVTDIVFTSDNIL